jgi:hypothetical protein
MEVVLELEDAGLPRHTSHSDRRNETTEKTKAKRNRMKL